MLLWWVERPERLSDEAHAAIEDAANAVLVSSVSLYESGYKAAIGKLDVRADLGAEAERIGFQPLPLTFAHAARGGALPLHHGDPFDRMLVAQALVERLTLVTRDERLGRYGVPVVTG